MNKHEEYKKVIEEALDSSGACIQDLRVHYDGKGQVSFQGVIVYDGEEE